MVLHGINNCWLRFTISINIKMTWCVWDTHLFKFPQLEMLKSCTGTKCRFPEKGAFLLEESAVLDKTGQQHSRRNSNISTPTGEMGATPAAPVTPPVSKIQTKLSNFTVIRPIVTTFVGLIMGWFLNSESSGWLHQELPCGLNFLKLRSLKGLNKWRHHFTTLTSNSSFKIFLFTLWYLLQVFQYSVVLIIYSNIYSRVNC